MGGDVHLIVDVKPDEGSRGYRTVKTRCGQKKAVKMTDPLADAAVTGWSSQVTCPGCRVKGVRAVVAAQFEAASDA